MVPAKCFRSSIIGGRHNDGRALEFWGRSCIQWLFRKETNYFEASGNFGGLGGEENYLRICRSIPSVLKMFYGSFR